MNISLRRAAALQNSISEAINAIKLNSNVDITVYENKTQKIEASRQQVLTNWSRLEKLISTLYVIRADVSKANSESGISTALTELARLQRLQQHLNNLSRIVPGNASIIDGRFDALVQKAKTGDGNYDQYGRVNDTINNVEALNEADVANFKELLTKNKRAIQSIKDTILELNVSTKIDIDEQVVAFLQAEGLL